MIIIVECHYTMIIVVQCRCGMISMDRCHFVILILVICSDYDRVILSKVQFHYVFQDCMFCHIGACKYACMYTHIYTYKLLFEFSCSIIHTKAVLTCYYFYCCFCIMWPLNQLLSIERCLTLLFRTMEQLQHYMIQIPLKQALIQDHISTSPSSRTVNPPHGRRTDIITYIIDNITIKGNYEPNLSLQIINVCLTSEQ